MESLLRNLVAVPFLGAVVRRYLHARRKDHRGSFLFDNAATRVTNYLSRSYPDSQFKSILLRCKRNGDNVIYLFLANYGDGPGTTNFYARGGGSGYLFGGKVDRREVDFMRKRLLKCWKKGLEPIAWFVADDSARVVPYRDGAVMATHAKQCCKEFGDLFFEAVVALEANETMSQQVVFAMADAAKRSSKGVRLGLHLTTGQWQWSAACPDVSMHYHQFGFGRPPARIEQDMRAVVSACPKPVIAAEYDKSSDSPNAKERGRAAMRGGARGTGNGR